VSLKPFSLVSLSALDSHAIMRLLQWKNQTELTLISYPDAEALPYVILSHTWGSDADEVTFDDIQNGVGQSKAGYAKILFCGH
jgi:hypothetical protein